MHDFAIKFKKVSDFSAFLYRFFCFFAKNKQIWSRKMLCEGQQRDVVRRAATGCCGKGGNGMLCEGHRLGASFGFAFYAYDITIPSARFSTHTKLVIMKIQELFCFFAVFNIIRFP
jgi:hypothetical protein